MNRPAQMRVSLQAWALVVCQSACSSSRVLPESRFACSTFKLTVADAVPGAQCERRAGDALLVSLASDPWLRGCLPLGGTLADERLMSNAGLRGDEPDFGVIRGVAVDVDTQDAPRVVRKLRWALWLGFSSNGAPSNRLVDAATGEVIQRSQGGDFFAVSDAAWGQPDALELGGPHCAPPPPSDCHPPTEAQLTILHTSREQAPAQVCELLTGEGFTFTTRDPCMCSHVVINGVPEPPKCTPCTPSPD